MTASEKAYLVESKRMTPTVLMRPAIFADGDMWCALYGENLQEGVAGFGETPEKAAINFDIAWLNQRTPAAMLKTANEKPGTNELEAAKAIREGCTVPVRIAIDLARAANDLLATTTAERGAPDIWLPRVDRLKSACRALLAAATS